MYEPATQVPLEVRRQRVADFERHTQNAIRLLGVMAVAGLTPAHPLVLRGAIASIAQENVAFVQLFYGPPGAVRNPSVQVTTRVPGSPIELDTLEGLATNASANHDAEPTGTSAPFSAALTLDGDVYRCEGAMAGESWTLRVQVPSAEVTVVGTEFDHGGLELAWIPSDAVAAQLQAQVDQMRISLKA